MKNSGIIYLHLHVLFHPHLIESIPKLLLAIYTLPCNRLMDTEIVTQELELEVGASQLNVERAY